MNSLSSDLTFWIGMAIVACVLVPIWLLSFVPGLRKWTTDILEEMAG